MKYTTEIKYINYRRKSREDRDAQILSLPSQKEWADETKRRRSISVVDEFEEAKSAKLPYQRQKFDQMIAFIKSGKAQGIICWKLDRLARNPEEAGVIIGMLKRGEIRHIITNEREYLPDDNAIITYVDFGMADQFTRDLGKGVKRGIDKKVDMGWRSGNVPLGYCNSKTKLKGQQDIYSDPERFSIVKQVLKKMVTGLYSAPQLLDIANDELGLRTVVNRRKPSQKLILSHLYAILSNTFYYGWYLWRNAETGLMEWKKGNHEPMITEEEFDLIQFHLGRKGRPRPKSHKFAFTSIMKCPCGCAITCDEKYKKQKNGNTHHYIYLRCTRKKRNPKCVEKAVEIEDFNILVDEILSKITISERFKMWAIKYLHEIRKEEAQTLHQVLENKQKRLSQITTQITNLALLFTSPENENRLLLSPDEYQLTKHPLIKEQISLEEDIKKQGEETRGWVELTERTFNFACYARMWFTNGNLDTKRAIFTCLGSDHLLNNQKVLLNIHKYFKSISDKKEIAEQELEKLEPVESVANQGEKVDLEQKIPVLCAMQDSNLRPSQCK